jgi:hypothetical protein
MPLNLFDEIGLAVRLQAVTELAAGARLALALEIGDFLSLVDQDPMMQGVPARLLRVFLEEIDIGAAFYAKAAFSAEAYANVVVTDTALGDALKGTKPGFNISAGAGAGLSAGAGFEILANLGVRSFPRLVGRTADILIDETVNGIAQAPSRGRFKGEVMSKRENDTNAFRPSDRPLTEYEEEQKALRKNLERLKAERLAREKASVK